MEKRKHSKKFLLIQKGLNKLKLREKIMGLFIFCVMIPLFTIDGVVIYRMIKEEQVENEYISETMAESVENHLKDVYVNCQNIAISLSQNYRVGEILGTDYESTYDYYGNYHKMTDNYFFQTLVRFENMKVKLYTSNDTVVSGGYVGRIDSIENTNWYKAYKESGKDSFFCVYYDPTKGITESRRCIYFIAKLNYNNNKYENFIRMDIDYSTLVREIKNLGHAKTIYIFGDKELLMSNLGNLTNSAPYETHVEIKNVAYEKEIDYLGNIKKIVVIDDGWTAMDFFRRNIEFLIAVLIFSIGLPIFVLYEIDYSIVHRIETLNKVFGKQVDGNLVKVEEPEGSDELGNLMLNYNGMVDEVNQLIQILYKDRLKEQEMNIAKQNAELLALQSQINPHFMFNALESIRMHSIIKGEEETAEMVEKLAVLQRQYVDWGQDMIHTYQEMVTVDAYLRLQKYRFGDKLRYELSVDDDCRTQLIPKLTVVTFVENACVHGMENKTSECWIFVRIYRKDTKLIIEIEDTGNGIDDYIVNEINYIARTVELDLVKNSKHVGIYNALLRLKMTMGDGYKFEMESEKGIGTMIQISIPVKEWEEEEA